MLRPLSYLAVLAFTFILFLVPTAFICSSTLQRDATSALRPFVHPVKPDRCPSTIIPPSATADEPTATHNATTNTATAEASLSPSSSLPSHEPDYASPFAYVLGEG